METRVIAGVFTATSLELHLMAHEVDLGSATVCVSVKRPSKTQGPTEATMEFADPVDSDTLDLVLAEFSP